MANSVTFYTRRELVGQTLTAWIAGLDCGDYLVAANGSITVPFGSDYDGLFTIAFLDALVEPDSGWGTTSTTIDIFYGGTSRRYTVPVVLGFTYPSRWRLLRPATQDDAKAKEGPAHGMTRRAHLYAALVHNASGLSVGTSLLKLRPMQFRDLDGKTALKRNVLYSGAIRDTIDDDYSLDSVLTVEQTRPYPASLMALGGFLNTEEE